MRPIATDVARSVVFVHVLVIRMCCAKMALNWSRCHLEGWLLWTQGTMY